MGLRAPHPTHPAARASWAHEGGAGWYTGSKARQALKEAFRKDVNCRASVRFLQSIPARLSYYVHSDVASLNCRQSHSYSNSLPRLASRILLDTR